MGLETALIVGGLGSAYGANRQAKAAKQAAGAQSAAADAATQLEREMFQQSREDMLPWLQAGSGALPELMRLAGMERYTIPGRLDQKTGVKSADSFAYRRSSDPNAMLSTLALDPGYMFRQTEGMRGLENSAAARGGLLSGNFIRNAQRYGQDLASQEYGNAFNRLAGIAGVGQTQAQQLAGLGSQYAGNVGQNMMNAANARASGYVGKANAQAGLMGDLTSLAIMGYGLGAFGGGK